jgi:hypothetical protein
MPGIGKSFRFSTRGLASIVVVKTGWAQFFRLQLGRCKGVFGKYENLCGSYEGHREEQQP